MPTLYDRQGNPIEIIAEQVPEALMSGQYGFEEGTKLNVINPAGEAVSISAEPQNLLKAIELGYKIESTEEGQERQLQEEYGGTADQIAAGTLGALRGVTFGLSDLAAEKLGAGEYVSKVKKANPVASVAGEIGGVAGSLLIPGGAAGAIGKLGKLGTGVKAVAKVGKAAEKGVLKALGGVQGGAIRQAVARGAASAVGTGVEGAVYGAGQWLSEASLGETDVTAESLLAHTGTGVLWGGLAGGALTSSGALIKKALGTGVSLGKRSAKGIVKMYEKATGNKAVKGLDKRVEAAINKPGPLLKTVGAVIGEDPGKLSSLMSKETALRATQSNAIRQNYVKKISDLLDEKSKLLDNITEQSKGKLKASNMDDIIKVGNDIEVVTKGRGLLDDIKIELDDMLEQGTGFYEGQGAIKKLGQSIDAEISRINKSLATGKKGDIFVGGVATDVFIGLDNVKRDLGKLRKALGRIRTPRFAHQETERMFQKFYYRMKDHLEDSSLYGKAAAAQKRINKPWSSAISRNPISRRMTKHVEDVDWEKVYKTDRGRITSIVDDIGLEKNRVYEEFFPAQLSDERELIDAIEESFDLSPALKKQTNRVRQITDDLGFVIGEARETVGAQNQLLDIVNRTSQISSMMPTVGGLGGYMVGGPVGAVAGLALGVLTNPGRMTHIRAAMHRLSSQINLDIAKSVKKYINNATKKTAKGLRGTKRITAPASLNILELSNWGDKKTKDKDRHEAFRRRSEELTEIVSNNNLMLNRLEQNVKPYHEAAPHIAEVMQIKSIQAAKYLHDKMPKPTSSNALTKYDYKPSDSELASWERIVSVVNNPLSILDNLSNGTLTLEEAKAVEAVYPRLYETIVLSLAEQIPELQDKLPYEERVNLSTLFDIPVEPTMDTSFMATLSKVRTTSPTQQQEGGEPEKYGKASKLSHDVMSLTETQFVQSHSV